MIAADCTDSYGATLFWNKKLHCHVHNSPLPDPSPRQLNAVSTENHCSKIQVFYIWYALTWVSIVHLHICLSFLTDNLPADFSVTNSIEPSPYCEVNRCPTVRWIPRIVCNPKVHYLIHNLPPPTSIPSQISAVHAPYLTSWRYTFILLSFILWIFHMVSFPDVSPPKHYKNLSSPLNVPNASPISFVFITLPELNFVSSTDHKAPRDAVFFTHLADFGWSSLYTSYSFKLCYMSNQIYNCFIYPSNIKWKVSNSEPFSCISTLWHYMHYTRYRHYMHYTHYTHYKHYTHYMHYTH